jgi:nicotinamide phosphoribosyltransferase
VIDNGGTIIIRPDSGDPIEVVTQAIERLMTAFGYTVNSKGYRILPPYIRVIQGDGVSPEMIQKILIAMKQQQQSADNVAFGMGAELLQKVNRDTLQFAMKASAINIDGTWKDVFKDPVTDTGKRSKKGRLALIKDTNDDYQTIREETLGDKTNELITIFRNGKFLKKWNFSEIRAKASLF